jgi:hypothetical protein
MTSAVAALVVVATAALLAAPAAAESLPVPPTVEPRAYAAWLRERPRGERRRIDAFCRRHRTDFQPTCGGIGPLHIPVPPMPRMVAKGEADPGPVSLYDSMEAWEAALTPAQRGYLRQACPPDEERPSSDLCGANTPLVIAFAGEPVTFRAGGVFAFRAGAPAATDWPTAATPWIALDRDGDGAITRGAELFGSDTPRPGGGTAVSGFGALAPLDDDHDGRIDARDAAFASLLLWRDLDGDQRSAPGELTPLASTVVAISLAARRVIRCDARDNCEGERATVTWRDASGALREGAVIDVYLPPR